MARAGLAAVAAFAVWWVSAGPGGTAAAQSPGGDDTGASVVGETAPASKQQADPGRVEDLLNLDLDQLSKVRVGGSGQGTKLAVPSSQLSSRNIELSDASTTGELARQAPSVSTRRTSAINLDPRVRGYHSGQLNASANGMTELKTRLDIDSGLSQIDPGIVEDITVIDGPYTSLYGPGFAFLAVDLLPAPRYPDGFKGHSATSLTYGSNGQTLYARQTVLGGGQQWGTYLSYGTREGGDYFTGGRNGYRIPSSYQKWDTTFALSFDVGPTSRVEFDFLHCEMNDVELPGVVYDLDNSRNDQFNLCYIVQEDRAGPRQLVLQTWCQQTGYRGDASREEKQRSLYTQFFTLPDFNDFPVNTIGDGRSDSLGVRLLRTFGQSDSPQWTVGADWRRVQQFYRERNLNAAGEIVIAGDIFGIPASRLDDYGVLTNLLLPWSDNVSFNVGGRVDRCHASFDHEDPVVTQIGDPSQFYWPAGFTEPTETLGMAYVTSKMKLTDHYTLTAGTAYAMRMPELAELYSDDPFVPIARFGNSYVSGLSTLSPERNLQFDLGIRSDTPKLSYGARGFYALIHDYIMPVPAFIDPTAPDFIQAPKVLGRDFRYFPPQWRTDLGTLNENADTAQAGYQYVNVDLVTLFGGDLFAEVRLRDWLSVYGSMAYVCGINQNPVVFVAAPAWSSPEGHVEPIGHSEGVPGIYPLNGTLGIRAFEPKTGRWLVEFSTRMVARQDNVAVSLSELPSPGFVTFALRGHYQLRKHVRLTAAIENLFNVAYAEPGSLAILNPQGIPTFVKEPGISALIGIDARF
jgi:iron complex outermembrane receptor protein